MSGGAEKPPDSHLTAERITHHEGFVEKKGPKDKDYEKQWLMLIGDRMVVYNQRIAKRELSTAKPLESVQVDKNWDIKLDSKDKQKMTIRCKAGVYKFKMSTPDDRDNWWIRFYALSKREHPKVHVLPGQTIALQEIIDTMESTRSESPVPSPTSKSPLTQTFVRPQHAKKHSEQETENKKFRFYPEHLIEGFKEEFPIPPTWFFEVNRAQAEELLLNNPEHGAILIRKSESRIGDYSLSMRQDPPINNPLAQPVIKHFSFRWVDKPGTFRLSIEETQPEMKTMYDLLAFFIEKHGGNVRPMQTSDSNVLKIMQHPYEVGLRVSLKDPENGERRQDNYLQPTRVAPDLPSRPRPDRQSLPASFNMPLTDIVAAGMPPPSNLNNVPHGNVTVPSSFPTQYVVPSHERPTYMNVGQNKLPAVDEDQIPDRRRRKKCVSTIEVPNFPPDFSASNARAPQLPPPRNRSVSTSSAPPPSGASRSYAASITDLYNTPTGETFVLQRHKPVAVLPLATPPQLRPRSKTAPGSNTRPVPEESELNEIFKNFGLKGDS